MFKDTCVPDLDRWQYERSYRPTFATPSSTVGIMATDNPISATLLDAKGKPIAQFRTRPPVGYCHPDDEWRS